MNPQERVKAVADFMAKVGDQWNNVIIQITEKEADITPYELELAYQLDKVYQALDKLTILVYATYEEEDQKRLAEFTLE